MYSGFRQQFQTFPAFSLSDIRAVYPHFDTKNLVYWQRKGYIQKIRNGYYRLTEHKLLEETLFFIANKIYSPSYISLESALGYYQVIPEAVYAITSVSTLKTNHFKTDAGYFSYKHIQPRLFFGYRLLGQTIFKIAELEKCILDYIYLHPNLSSETDFDSLRWNRFILREINTPRLEIFLKQYESKALEQRIRVFQAWLNQDE